MKQIKRFGVVQTAKVAGAVYLVMGVAVGVLTFVGLTIGGIRGPAFGGVMALLLPIAYAVVGALATALMCVIYNLIAERIGGIEIDLG